MATASNLEYALAINGGAPVRTAPFPPWPVLEEEEIEAATAVLRSGRLNYWTGNEGRAFEREFAEFTGRKYAIALANGTVALELALHCLGIGSGDEVVVPSRTFIASASCAVMRGATPVVADVDRNSSNLTAETIDSVLTSRTKAIVAVHLAGWPCEMGPILELARARGIAVIEDCAQAHGARYRGRPVGSFGDLAAFSFCQDKNMTTGGEGGMLLTNDLRMWELGWSFKDHGKSYEAVYERNHPPGYRFLHESFGTNWRLTEVQSAIGRVLLRKLPGDGRKAAPERGLLERGDSQGSPPCVWLDLPTMFGIPTISTTSTYGRSVCARGGTGTESKKLFPLKEFHVLRAPAAKSISRKPFLNLCVRLSAVQWRGSLARLV